MNPFRASKLSSWGGPNLKELLRREWASRDEGERQLEQGNFFEAEKHLALAVAEARQRSMASAVQARVLRLLATAQLRQQKLDKALDHVDAAVALLGDANSKDGPELAHCLDVKGCILLAEEQTAEASALIGEAIGIEEKFKKPSPAILAERYRHLAQVRRMTEAPDEALAMLEKSLKLAEESVGAEHILVADILADRASIFQHEGRLDEGYQCLERALAIHKHTRGADSEEVTADYERLAALCQESGNLEGALDHYQKALYIRERQLGGNAPELAVLLMKCAEVYVGLGRIGPALEQMQQAVMKLELARDERLPVALETMGGLYVRCGRPEDAVNSLTRARTAWQQLPGDNSERLESNHQAISQLVRYLSPAQMDALAARGQRMPYVKRAAQGQLQPDGSVLLDPQAVAPFPSGFEDLPAVMGSPVSMGDVPMNLAGPGGAPINLTIVMREGGVEEMRPSVAPSLAALAEHVTRELHGWEDLAFDRI